MKRLRTGVGVVVLALVLSGCAAVDFTKGLFVAGVSLEAVGNQFVSVSTQVTAGCAAKAIREDSCEKYRVFGEHFKKAYPVAVELWKSAKAAGDKAAVAKAEEVIIQLSEDLSRLMIEILQTFAPEGK